jgi:cysteine desulfurase/selenocysteine lyase
MSLRKLLSPRTRLVAIAHVSNALGTVLPVKRMIAAAHAHGARVLVDGAQAVPHSHVDVRALDADFYAFSSHKLYGPTGIGVLYGREELLGVDAALAGRRRHDPHGVTFEKSTYNELPWKFEAGTPTHLRRGRTWLRPSTMSSPWGSRPSPPTSSASAARDRRADRDSRR